MCRPYRSRAADFLSRQGPTTGAPGGKTDGIVRRATNGKPNGRQIGERLRLLRERRGLTQAGLARAVGVGARCIRRYEAGAAGAPISVIVRIARALGGSTSMLVDDEGDRWRHALRELVRRAPDGTAELVAAFADVRDPEARRAFLDLAWAIVRSQGRPPVPG